MGDHQMQFSRRGLIAGASALLALPASAERSLDYRKHEAFSAWQSPPEDSSSVPLDVVLETGDGEIALRDWMQGRPAIIALWASWCTPCLVEKAGEAKMTRRLAEAGARTQMLFIQAYDDMPLADARNLLKRLGAGGLVNARATPAAEKSFVKYFGASSESSGRPFMPSLILVDSDGTELGRTAGMMRGRDRLKDYWFDDSTLAFLAGL